ncbi:MAG: hypothetical protein K5768_06260 [Firmicutes bacterium]|nr:hypothetical protein [Bacillota bacterium]
MFYLWGHSYEFDNNDNWEVIENFAKFIGVILRFITMLWHITACKKRRG